MVNTISVSRASFFIFIFYFCHSLIFFVCISFWFSFCVRFIFHSIHAVTSIVQWLLCISNIVIKFRYHVVCSVSIYNLYSTVWCFIALSLFVLYYLCVVDFGEICIFWRLVYSASAQGTMDCFKNEKKTCAIVVRIMCNIIETIYV